MDFGLSREHEILRDTVREFAQRELAPKALALDEKGEYIHDIIKKTAELGLVGIITSREYDGSGMGHLATVKPGIFSPQPKTKRNGETVKVEVKARPSRLEIVEVVEEQEKTASLEQAEVIVAGGWGLNSVGGFKPVLELAQILNGTVAGTRPAVDAGWIPAERMIGQSGKTVAPQLMLTLGISGAAQFATGTLNSKFIVAVDKNPKAPLFEMADIGIVGDLKDVLPLLIEKLRVAKQKP
jgi:electron transfer flavoprotein alpha subunit